MTTEITVSQQVLIDKIHEQAAQIADLELMRDALIAELHKRDKPEKAT